MTECNEQYIVVKSQYVLHILQYIAIHFWHIVTALVCVNIEETHQPSQSDQSQIIYWPDRIITT